MDDFCAASEALPSLFELTESSGIFLYAMFIYMLFLYIFYFTFIRAFYCLQYLCPQLIALILFHWALSITCTDSMV